MKKKLRFIIAIMGLSLISLSVFQGYWLYKSYGITREQFKWDVADVLQRTNYITALDEVLKEKFFLKDSVVSDHAFASKFSGMLLSIRAVDNMKKPGTKKKDIGINIALTLSGDSSSSGRKVEKTRKKKERSYTLKSDVVYTTDDLARFYIPLRKRIDSLLKEKGIHTRFAVKLSNLNGKGKPFISNVQEFNSFREKPAPVKIGLLDVYEVRLALDSNTAYLIRGMQWILLASLVILIIIACSFIYMLRTIYEQKKIAEIKNDFINNMTHEFKTPITTVALGIEAMKNFEVLHQPGLAIEYLDICEHEIKRVADMVEKVLKISAFERSEVKLVFQPVDLILLVQQVIDNMQLQLKNKEVELIFNHTEKELYVKADETHLTSVIYNLIDNSIKYSGASPWIEINCHQNENAVWIAIKDNGIGIDEGYQKKVFDKFFRVPVGQLANIGGFGLGLSYAANIISMHNGNITLESKLGKGSVFTIHLLR
ncbi:two-component system phosphate regulon sensor histidine kinase PhoR [Pedobacter cryoconitis]|uniref:sensor histidine kinase n=1 Tax=Pedobacter cryoconitis TaxID=188932 RepID=UPI00161311B9|nr:HAMP domain-containing sensor histidine kinase [Pedobacter cryoconitis]MBB6272318.1 two-component system phosphate regulon sensor histidine kinase PhoR [Pedobacter cryoconitis]